MEKRFRFEVEDMEKRFRIEVEDMVHNTLGAWENTCSDMEYNLEEAHDKFYSDLGELVEVIHQEVRYTTENYNRAYRGARFLTNEWLEETILYYIVKEYGHLLDFTGTISKDNYKGITFNFRESWVYRYETESK